MGPIGSAVLTFIGYKQTDKQTDKPNLYIDELKLESTPIAADPAYDFLMNFTIDFVFIVKIFY